jgi:hypothetical protein
MMNRYLLRTVINPVSFSLLVFSTLIFPQPNYLMGLENAARINDTIIEFEVYIRSNSAPFILTSYQCAFTFNNEIINGGNISFSCVEGSSQLNNIPYYGIGVNNYDNQLKLTFASLVGSDTVSSISKRVGKFRLRNSVPFDGLGLSVLWSFSGIVNSILTGAYFVNITNPVYHSNLNVFWDTTAPAIQSISIIDSSNLIINFSEILDTTYIRDLNNYSITNGIDVLSADAISPWDKISLITSVHALGSSYTISVQHLKDLSGNVTTPPGNSCNYAFGEILSLSLKTFLQGPFKSGVMSTSLNELRFIPLKQPFNTSPWNYQGIEQTTNVPPDVVDWILVELRSGLNGSTTVVKRAAFVKRNGVIVDIDGSNNLRFLGSSGLYYVVIKHRNHLGVISSNRINISTSNSFYDFTTSMNSAYGTNSLIHLGNNLYGLYAGDGNGNGNINNTDLNAIWKKENGKVGYKSGDFDLNGGVNIMDKNSYWQINKGKTTNIPIE